MTQKQAQILTMIDEAKKGYDLYKSDFKTLEMGYKNILPDEVVKSLEARKLSHITPKVIAAKVRKVSISVLKTYFENDEFAKLTPQNETTEDFENVAKLQEALDSWTTKKINLYTRFKPMVDDALVYGTPIAKIYWANGRLNVERVRIENLWIDPNAQTVYDIQYCVNKVISTVGKLKKQFGRKFKWKNYIGQLENGNTQVSTVDIGDASRVEVMDVYRFQDGKWLLSTILPDQTFIRTDEPLKDGLPFIIGNVYPQFIGIEEKNAVPAYGGSFIEPMIPLQDEYTVMRNKQIDAIDKHLEHRFLATKTSGLKESDLVSSKRKVNVSNLAEVQELQLPRLQESIFNVDRLDSEMQEVSGVPKTNQGLVDSSNKYQTATGMSILTQEGNSTIEDIVRALNESFFEPAIKKMVRLIYKYDETPILYGIDRTKNIEVFVSINAGVGAVNKEILANNISAMEGSAQANFKMFTEVGDSHNAAKFAQVLTELSKEKAKALGLKTLIPILKGELEEDEPRTDGEQGEAGTPLPNEAVGGLQDIS